MSATHYGIDRNAVTPQADFRASRDASGLWTASRSYKCHYSDFDNAQLRDLFAKGTILTDIDSTLGAYWDFLKIETIDVEDEPGGIKSIFVESQGFSTDELSGSSEREITYELRGVLTERDILLNPNYLNAVTDTRDRASFSGYIEGKLFVDDSASAIGSNYYMRNVADQNYQNDISNASAVSWFTKILEGLRTYQAGSVEWTKTATNVSGLSAAEYTALGWIDTPDGSPPAIHANATWIKTTINDVRGEGFVTTSETWLNSGPEPWDTDVYTKPA